MFNALVTRDPSIHSLTHVQGTGWTAYISNFLAQHIPLHTGRVHAVLDVAAGSGGFALAMKKLYDAQVPTARLLDL